MENLPQELVSHISSYLERDDLKRTLFVSRFFQYAAEEYSGAFTAFDLTPDTESAARFLNTYCGRHNRHLRHVGARTNFPALEWDRKTMDVVKDRPSCRYSQGELQQMDQIFTEQIISIFSTLKMLEDSIIGLYPGAAANIDLTVYTPTRAIDKNWYCWHQFYVSWRVHLLSPETLPELTLVRSLQVKNGSKIDNLDGHAQHPAVWKLDHRVLLDLAEKLPNLEQLKCHIGGDEWNGGLTEDDAKQFTRDWEGPRRDSRRDFGQKLASSALPSLQELDLNFMFPFSAADYIDQRQPMPNLVSPAKYDIFSSNLHLFSQNLRKMSIRGIVDETLFWPQSPKSTLPLWPRLEFLNVMFHMSTPTGKWYFNGLNNEGAADGYEITNLHYPPYSTTAEDRQLDGRQDYIRWETYDAQFRFLPNQDLVVPLLTAFAKAAARMPSLKVAMLWSPITLSAEDVSEFYEDFEPEGISESPLKSLAWGVCYISPGVPSFRALPQDPCTTGREIWWNVGSKWQPDKSLSDLFRQIGLQEHGGDIEEIFDEGQGLVDRGLFKRFESRWFGYRPFYDM
ncbi:hypothetical protein K505DRAFT_287605 [Melanomma pulvis-pyrius CBS 109.77]|uniref:F-box domain-containing protein n=1 Tax=Melanomma pulvis-pyrius CBS 109.77 TaxID=1314802 RepID=A0A6A6WUM3_9PLEO|nr:hypothetical protein K505DRAFT_287605 [Melanomma pulvis-pyrius CBS 109.77]